MASAISVLPCSFWPWMNFLQDYELLMGLSDLGPFTSLNVDLSTITAATDIAFGHGDPPDRIVDINFQSGPDEELPGRVLLYNALLHFRYRVAVHSIVGSCVPWPTGDN